METAGLQADTREGNWQTAWPDDYNYRSGEATAYVTISKHCGGPAEHSMDEHSVGQVSIRQATISISSFSAAVLSHLQHEGTENRAQVRPGQLLHLVKVAHRVVGGANFTVQSLHRQTLRTEEILRRYENQRRVSFSAKSDIWRTLVIIVSKWALTARHITVSENRREMAESKQCVVHIPLSCMVKLIDP